MAGPSRPSRPRLDRSAPVLAAVLVVAIVAGIAATFLAAPASAPIEGRGPVSDSFSIIIDFSEALVVLVFGGVLLFALLTDRKATAVRFTGVPAIVLSMFLVALGFIALVHLVAPNPSALGANANGTNPSNPPPPPGPPLPNATKNLTNGTFGPLPWGPIPGWVVYLGLAVAVLVAVVLLAPALRRSVDPAAREDAIAPVRRSLEEALEALADEQPSDARRSIMSLYARLLQTVGPYVDNLEASTPREIERVAETRFGIAPAHAGALTRLFEEARYSSHPFTSEQVDRARAALAAALHDVKVRSYTGGG